VIFGVSHLTARSYSGPPYGRSPPLTASSQRPAGTPQIKHLARSHATVPQLLAAAQEDNMLAQAKCHHQTPAGSSRSPERARRIQLKGHAC